ncbi:hypothetical protein GR294_01725 [Raoultella sp. Lac2]|uniref:hypothetical protein n=1 Tax=unclassified Raoultella TaxID=2627600 RepID=UPI0013558AD2|nr:hypothetical protein [Raoultella sp. Lac2]MXF97279.1 hypothetical protein [Raoultella sp. Lac1]
MKSLIDATQHRESRRPLYLLAPGRKCLPGLDGDNSDEVIAVILDVTPRSSRRPEPMNERQRFDEMAQRQGGRQKSLPPGRCRWWRIVFGLGSSPSPPPYLRPA